MPKTASTTLSSKNKNEKLENGSGYPGEQSEDVQYPSTAITLTVMASCMTSMFLVSLDRTIISTAIPYITDQFHSVNDIGWYGSAYMLSSSALQLLYGKIYKFYPVKNVFFCAIGLFEIGSAVCGAAPNSLALIIGRAIAGAGSSGVMSGVMQILVHLVPLSKRPMYTGLLGSIHGISAVVGPVLGGAFTERVSWRWCFYINLPFAAVSIITVFFLMKTPRVREQGLTLPEQLKQFDPIGIILFIPCIVCLILALQWGGVKYAWNNPRLIVLWVVFGITLIAWVAVQAWKKDTATVPPRIFFQRSIVTAFLYAGCTTSSMITLVYYIPIWFQATKGVSPVTSGLSLLPFVLAMIVSSVLGGLFTQKIGYYVPVMICSSVFSSIGSGFLTTFKPDTGHPRWIGLQFLCGFGLGMGMQQASLAAQAVLPPSDVPIGIALMFFAQQICGTIFLSVGQSVFSHELENGLASIDGVDDRAIFHAGATQFRNIVPDSLLPAVLSVYNSALVQAWYVALVLQCAAIIPALCMEWTNIKRKTGGPGEGSDESNPPEKQRGSSPVSQCAVADNETDKPSPV